MVDCGPTGKIHHKPFVYEKERGGTDFKLSDADRESGGKETCRSFGIAGGCKT